MGEGLCLCVYDPIFQIPQSQNSCRWEEGLLYSNEDKKIF